MRFVADFLHNHGMLQVGDQPQWRVVQGGSLRYVERLIPPFADRIRTGATVEAIRREEKHVRLRIDGQEELYDEVVLACHADQALRLLEDPSEKEGAMLRGFPYQRNRTLLHTDANVLPRKRAAWASWNYRIPREDSDHVHVTYRMNELQTLQSQHQYLVTLNDPDTIAEERILERLEYEHPQMSSAGRRWQPRQGEFIRRNRTSFCGAYWGFGFHEDGVRSAVAVGQTFGEELLP
jgi:predicted NAD/FAD-binding protein